MENQKEHSDEVYSMGICKKLKELIKINLTKSMRFFCFYFKINITIPLLSI